MRIVIEVELGNESMQTYGDIARAVARSFDDSAARARHDVETDVARTPDADIVRDLNGNTVGRWEVQHS